MNNPLYVGLDVGGSTMKAGVVEDSGRPLSSVSLPTEAHKGQEHGLAQMCAAIRRAVADARRELKDIAAIGVATPGLMDLAAGVILDPPNLKPWRNVPVRRHIQEVFGLPTAFQNDANAAAYGEYWAGAGRGVHSMVLFTLGTGVGGGIILGDRIVEGQHSHGAELGHIKIEMTQPRLCGCGRRGCLEAYASATAVVNRTLEALASFEEGVWAGHSCPADPARAGMPVPQGSRSLDPRSSILDPRKELTARDVFEAAAAGDALAAKIVEETAYYLAVGTMNLMHVIDPDMVVFGGGMIAAGEGFLERIRHHVRELAFPVPAERTRIRYAQLGSDAGFIGAAACGRQLVRPR